MKVEALCPDCDGAYLVEVSVFEQGFPCPGCGRTLGGTTRRGSVPGASPETSEQPLDMDRPVAAAATAAPAVAAPAKPRASAPVAASGASPAAEVVCPRCHLHFRPRAQNQSRERKSAGRPVVLVVEDMEYFREIAAEALAGEYEVKAVATKQEALAALEAGGIDLMVLDLTLEGGEGGLELLHELPGKPCPVLIYTAQDESEMYGGRWEELQRFGADDIVIKGLSVGDELVRKVGSMLGRNPDENDR